jgi:hypothetical protein
VLDATLILQDVEELLDEHFGQLRTAWQAQQPSAPAMPPPAVEVTPAPTARLTQPAPSAPPTNPVTNLLTGLVMLVMFSVLDKRLSS